MDRNALDWLFSTAPQAIAALVGLIFTGVVFFIGTIEKEMTLDDTRAEICEVMKQDIHNKMKWLYWMAGVSIVLDFVLLILNPIVDDKIFSLSGNFDWYLTIDSLIFGLNIITVGFSLWFIVRVANPSYFKNTVHRMSGSLTKGDGDVKDFISAFIEFEKVLRELPLDVTLDSRQVQRFASMSKMLRELKYRGWLDTNEIDDLYRFNRIRNLVVHGADIDHVKSEDIQGLRAYTKKLIQLRDRLEEK